MLSNQATETLAHVAIQGDLNWAEATFFSVLALCITYLFARAFFDNR